MNVKKKRRQIKKVYPIFQEYRERKNTFHKYREKNIIHECKKDNKPHFSWLRLVDMVDMDMVDFRISLLGSGKYFLFPS